MSDRSRSPAYRGSTAQHGQRTGGSGRTAAPAVAVSQGAGPAVAAGLVGARPFTGVRAGGAGNFSTVGAGGHEHKGPVDPLDAYMASVHRELERNDKGKKKSKKVGDVASAREAFGPQALQKLRPGGFEARDTDTLQEDKLLR
mmetsp:Transcript_106485/g.301226  ORF Transcript_106485/g.301226 Transcript_106485/m.301226 type:complete len:143 (-) Transcript_106485:93-521(-)